jgi:hypothetical protein
VPDCDLTAKTPAGYHKHSLPGMSHRGWQNDPARLFANGDTHTTKLIKIQQIINFFKIFFINL